ncbi:MAG: alpha/beta fold hydrolase [Candidatus Krumholzibacteria bacterium]|nr:alpha/beta fold hydrolase [Candidatus Krumholzibacteria bacterium]
MNDGTFEIRPYRFQTRAGVAVDAERGHLAVPERHAGPDSRGIALAFVRLRAKPGGGTMPVVFLAGGPGESAIDAARGGLSTLFDALRRAGDVILLDQRGCGASYPSLLCAGRWTFPLERTLTRKAALDLALDASRRCAHVLRERGVDLDAYHTGESADDVSALCDALGAERVHLVGHSYGSHLAMAVIKRHPARVASAVLAGPEGPDHTLKLPSAVERQLVRLGELAGVDVATLAKDAIASLRASPRTVRVAPDGKEREVTVGPFDVEWIASAGAADPRLLRLLPAWLARAGHGDLGDFAREPLLARYLLHLRSGLGRSALPFCVDCASGATAARRERIAREAATAALGRTIDFPFPEICAAWEVPDLGDGFRAPPRADLPVLFVTGKWDCRTPAENVDDLAPGLPNHRHVVVEEAGHMDLLAGDEIARRITAFLCGEEIDTTPIRGCELLHPASIEAAPTAAARPVLVYDGACAFCRRALERIRRRAGDRIEYAPYQEAAARFPSIPRREFERAVQLVDLDGTATAGAEAILRAYALSGRRAGLWMYRHFPGFRWMAERIYDWVARYRGRLGR